MKYNYILKFYIIEFKKYFHFLVPREADEKSAIVQVEVVTNNCAYTYIPNDNCY